MSILLSQLSPAALECLAELIEQRLEAPETPPGGGAYERTLRDNAARELDAAAGRAGLTPMCAIVGLPRTSSPAAPHWCN